MKLWLSFAVDDDRFAGSGGVGGDDIEVHPMVLDGLKLGGVVSGGRGCGFGEEFLAFELKLLALEIEVGEFLDVGEEFLKEWRRGLRAHQLEGGFGEHLIHGGLNAGGLGEVGLLFQIDDDIERRVHRGDEVFGAPGITEPPDGSRRDVHSEAFRGRRFNAAPKVGNIIVIPGDPIDEFTGLFRIEGVEEGIGALLLLE